MFHHPDHLFLRPPLRNIPPFLVKIQGYAAIPYKRRQRNKGGKAAAGNAQGIEAEIPQAPPNIRTRKRVDEPMRRGVAPANAAVRKNRDAAGRGIGAESGA
jgi:hypothetical protein